MTSMGTNCMIQDPWILISEQISKKIGTKPSYKNLLNTLYPSPKGKHCVELFHCTNSYLQLYSRNSNIMTLKGDGYISHTNMAHHSPEYSMV